MLRGDGRFDFGELAFEGAATGLGTFATTSGLLGAHFSQRAFAKGHRFDGDVFVLLSPKHVERYAQLIAQFLYDRLLGAKRKLSLETVMSHRSKLDLMRRAKERGYKVYLYFVATSDVDINVQRVSIRVSQGGHDVPAKKIRERYSRTLALLPEAFDIVDTAYFWDNSTEQAVLFCEMTRKHGKRVWKWLHAPPAWFASCLSKLPRAERHRIIDGLLDLPE